MRWSWTAKLAAALAAGGVAGVAACNAVLDTGKFTFGSCETKGARQCMGNTPYVCTAEGTWEAGSPCTGQACDSDSGLCVGVCAPDKERCSPDSGVKLERCNPEGQWQFQSNCTYVCANDQCGGECVPDASTCSHGDNKPSDYGSTIMTCSPDGHWIPMPHPCVNGMPTDCEPFTSRCLTDTQAQPCGDAGSWLDAGNCVAPQVCFYNSGACDTPCKPGIDVPRCQGKEIQNCQPVTSGGGLGTWVDMESCDRPCTDCNAGSCVNTPNAACKANCVKSGICDNGGTCIPDPNGGEVDCVFVPLDAGVCGPTDCDPSAHTCACDLDSGTCGAPDTLDPQQGQKACNAENDCVTTTWCQSGTCTSSEELNHHWAHWQFPKSTPTPRYFTTAEVVYDQVTHLMWQRNPEPSTLFTNADASTYCMCLDNPPPVGTTCAPDQTHIAGYPQGWRLPTRIELVSLVQYEKQGTKLIDTTVFNLPQGLSLQYWSASVLPAKTSAWRVDFNTGLVGSLMVDTPLPVRCVR